MYRCWDWKTYFPEVIHQLCLLLRSFCLVEDDRWTLRATVCCRVSFSAEHSKNSDSLLIDHIRVSVNLPLWYKIASLMRFDRCASLINY